MHNYVIPVLISAGMFENIYLQITCISNVSTNVLDLSAEMSNISKFEHKYSVLISYCLLLGRLYIHV
jgi:hypothetical protein